MEGKGRRRGREREIAWPISYLSIDSRNEGNESKREEKKFFGKTLFPPSPFGAITELFSEPDENLVGLRGRKFLRSLGGGKKERKKKSSIVFHGKQI